ncbi:MAG: fibronectin type III domain-containing protein [Oscillospiraceae bacterium]|nr:fibronectin type III domain-containing protein [Oscillospiraceae bacterium]
MNIKKIAAAMTAVTLALGAVAVLPAQTDIFGDISITVSAAGDFTVKTDKDGLKYVSAYNGKGGDVVIPADVDYIGESAFAGNTAVKSVTFPKSCDWVDYGAFQECTALEKVVFEGDGGIGSSAFEFCINLKTVTVKGGMAYPIYSGAFWGCQSLKTVKITNSKAVGDEFAIGGNAFRDCFSLTSINIPENCSDIYGCAFLNCFSLTKLTIPANTKINDDAGDDCHFGYAAVYKSKADYEDHANGGEAQADVFVANGKKSGYFDKYSAATKAHISDKAHLEDYYTIGNNMDICLGVKKYTPKQLTVTVTKGSSAEKWAKANKVKYVYAGSSSSSGDKLAAPANIKASKGDKKITLTWDKVSGADAYRVYMYNEKTGKYEKYKDVTSAKCTVSDLKSGTAYKFKVAALVKKDGKYSVQTSSKAVSASTK